MDEFLLPHEASLRGLDEVEEDFDVFSQGTLVANSINRFLESKPSAEQSPICSLQRIDTFRTETLALQANAVDVVGLGVVSISNCLDKRECIPGQRRVTTDEGVNPDSAELMDSDKGTHRRVIANLDMAGQGRPVGHDHVIADVTVVGYVRPSHQQIVASHGRAAASPHRSSVNGDKFPHDVVVPVLELGWLAVVLEILRRGADRAVPREVVVPPDAGRALHQDV